MPERTRRWLAALGGAWFALVVMAVLVGVPGERDHLAARAAAAIGAAGVDATIRVDGRDVAVDVLPGDRPAVRTALESVRGIRTVEFRIVPRPPEPVVVSPSSSTTSSVAPTTTMPPAHLTARLHAGTIELAGVVPAPEIAGAIEQVTTLIYAPLVEGSVTVGRVAPAVWSDGVARAIAVLPIVAEATLTVDGERALLEGSAPSAARKAKLLGTVSAALGPEVTVVDRVGVSGLRPPTFHAEAPGDGTLTISGTVPNREVAEALRAAATASFGRDRVVDRIVVDRDTDASFSLYRLPFVIPRLAAIPQWTLDIDDDVITGSLRGGATFPSGSAELSPQLLALLDTAAGILARNPTLGIVIEGHTDSVGTREANQRLSERRAGNAKDRLVESGIEPGRIVAVGFGETRPIAPNTTREGRARNRRVEFRFGPLDRLQGGN